MNKIFKVIWNQSTQSWVAVSELHKSKGKSASKTDKRVAIGSIMALTAITTMSGAYAATNVIAGNTAVTSSNSIVFVETAGTRVVIGNNANGRISGTTSTEIPGGAQTVVIGANANSGAVSGNINTGVATGQPGSVVIGFNATGHRVDSSQTSHAAYGNKYNDLTTGANVTGTAVAKNGTAVTSSVVVVGRNAEANYGSVAVGDGAYAGEGSNDRALSISVGANAHSYDGGIAIGSSTLSKGVNSFALGRQAAAIGAAAQAFGSASAAVGAGSTAIGHSAQSLGARSIAFGASGSSEAFTEGTVATADDSIAIGTKSSTKAGATNAIAIGKNAKASALDSIAMGTDSNVTGSQSIAIGVGHQVSGDNSGAFGDPNIVSGNNSYAFGNNNTVNSANAFVLGNNVTTTTANSVFLGTGSNFTAATTDVFTSTTEATGTTAGLNEVSGAKVNGIEYGGFAGSTAEGVVSVGTANNERRIQGVAAGLISAGSTDAINGSQLYAVADKLNKKNYFHTNPSDNEALQGGANNLDVVDGVGSATGGKAIAAGVDAAASGKSAVAMGRGATADSLANIAIGEAAQAVTADKNTGAQDGKKDESDGVNKAIAIGASAKALNAKTIAVGDAANASGKNSSAIGSQANVSGEEATGIGTAVTASGNYSTAIGQRATATNRLATAIGSLSKATGEEAVAIGRDALSEGSKTVAIGSNSVASGSETVAMGSGANSSAAHSVAISTGANATANQAIAIGKSAKSFGASSIAIGDGAKVEAATATNSVAIGQGANATAASATAVGRGAAATGTNAFAGGREAKASQVGSVAMGYNATSSQVNAISIGTDSSATQANAVALGRSAAATLSGSVALGVNATTSASVAVPSATVNGITYSGFAASTTVEPGYVVSVGKAGAERQIQNVAAGQISATSTDAINGSQLYSVITQGAWELQAGGNKVGDVNFGDKVNFQSTDGSITITPTAEANGVSTLDLQIKRGLGIALNSSGVLSVANTTLVQHAENMRFSTPRGQQNSFVKADDLARHLNNVGFNLSGEAQGGSFEDTTADVGEKQLRNGNVLTMIAGPNMKINQVRQGFEFSVEGENVTYAGNKATVPTKDDGSVDDSSVATAKSVAEAINHSGFTLKTSAVTGGEKLTGSGEEVINPADAVEMIAGKNLTVQQGENGKITYATKDDVTFNSVTANNTTTNNLKVNPNGNVDMGGNQITNVASGGDVDNNAANIGDVKTAVETAKEKVIAGTNIVNVVEGKEGERTTFTVNAKGTTASSANEDYVTVKADPTDGNNVTNYKVDLGQKAKDSLAKADTAVQNIASPDGSVIVSKAPNDPNTTNLQVNRGTGISLDVNGRLTVTKTTLDQSPTTMEFAAKRGQTNNFVNAGDLADHLNKAGFKLAVGKTGGVSSDTASNEEAKRIRTGETLTMTAGKGMNIKQVDHGYEFSVDSAEVGVADNKATVPADSDNKMASVGSVAKAINESGFTLKTSANGGELVQGSGDEVINPADIVDMAAGKNLTVQQGENGKITYATKDDVTFNSVTANSTTTTNLTVKPNGNVNMGGNKITNVAKGEADTDAVNVSQLNEKLGNSAWNLKVAQDAATATNVGDGKINGDNTVTFTGKGAVKVSTTTSATEANNYGVDIALETQALQSNADGKVETKGNSSTGGVDNTAPNTTALATAGDVIEAVNNSFWKVFQGDATTANKKDDVKAGDNVVFADGTGTTASVETSPDGTTTTVKYNIDKGDIQVDENTGKVTQKAGEGDNKVATTQDVVDAISKAGFKLKASATDGQEDGSDREEEVINAGDTVEVVAGKNLKVKQTADGKITLATLDDVSFNKVTATTSITAGTGANQVILNNDGVNVGGKTYISGNGLNANNQVISNVAPGVAGTDAVNVNQLKASQTKVVKGTNVASVTSDVDNTTGATTYTVNADGANVVGAGDVEVTKGTKNGTTNITDYTVDLKQETKDNIQKGVDAKDIVDNKGLTFTGDSGTTTAKKLGESVKVKGDDNITTKATANEIEVTLNRNLNVDTVTATDSVTAGTGDNQVVLNDDGVNVGGKTYINNDGLNANNQKITNVANGVDDNDAVNMSQLKDTVGQSAWNLKVAQDAATATNVGDGKINGDNTVTFTGKGAVKVSTTTSATEANNYGVDIALETQALQSNADGKVETKGNSSTGGVDNTAPNTTALATAGDVIEAVNNSFWKVFQGDATTANKKDDVKAGDNVVFADGTGTTASVETSLDGTTTTVKYNIDKGDIQVDENTGKVTQKAGEGDNKVATTQDVVDAISKAGFKLKASATDGQEDGSDREEEVINAGDTVEVVAGKNLKVKQTADGKITLATLDDVSFNKVTATTSITAGTGANQVILNNDGVNVGGKTYISGNGLNANNQVISNVAPGVAGTDAVNVNQLKASQTKVVKGTNVASVTSDVDNTTGATTYTVNADGANVVGAGDVEVTKGTKNGTTNITDYTVDLKQETKDNIQKGVDAKDIVDNKGLTFTGDSGTTTAKKLGESVKVKGDDNITTKATANEIEVTLNRNLNVDTVTATDSVTAGTGDNQVVLNDDGVNVGGKTYINNDGLNANDQKITNVAPGVDGTDAVNVNQLNQKTAAAKTEVESVDGSVNIEERQGDNGQTIYDLSVNQSGLEASDDKKTVSATKAGNAFATAEDVANAINTAAAAATTEVTSENGSITVTESRGDNGQNIYDLEVTKATLSYDNDGKVVSNKDGDAFATGKNVADMINNAASSAKTEVTGSGFAVVTEQKGANGQTIYNVDVAKANAPTVARGSVTVKAADEDKVMTAGDVAKAITDSEKTSSVKAGSKAVTVTPAAEDANGNTEYTVDVATDKTIARDNGGKLTVNTGSSLKVDGTTGKIDVNTDGTTITTDSTGAVKANTTALTNDNKGKVNTPAEPNALATAGDIANAINNSGFTLKTSANGGSKVSGKDEVINPGETIDMAAGKNLTVTQDANGKVTYATSENVTFTTMNSTTVVVGNPADANNSTTLTSGNGGLNVGGDKITGVAEGDITPTSKDAVNGSQIFALTGGAKTTIGDVTVTNPDGSTTTYKNVVLDENGNPALVTYNVKTRGEHITNSVVTAIKNMNTQGIKFFHTNDGKADSTRPSDQRYNSEDSSASGAFASAVGYQAEASGTSSVAIGNNATASGANAIAIGVNSQATGKNTISIGNGNIVTGENSGAFGDPSKIDATNSYSVGNNNELAVGQTDVFALGNNVKETASNSVFLGSESGVFDQANANRNANTGVHTKTANSNYTYRGENDANVAGVNNAVGVVSVGNAKSTRQVQGVAAGVVSETSTDAINGSQLYYTNKAIGDLKGDVYKLGDIVNKNNRQLRAGIAGANAAAGLPQVYLPGKSMVAASAGTFKGEGALAVGYSRASDNGKLILKLQGNTNTRGDVGGSVGVGYQW